jgi:hypothetical protein
MLPSLLQAPELERLPGILREFGVDIILHGSVAQRLFTAAEASSPRGSWPSLFNLNPFISDIDIIHTGPRSRDGKIAAPLHRIVPLAECFRREARSASDYATEFDDTRLTALIVPANLVSIAAANSVDDPWRFWDDLQQRRVRLIRNDIVVPTF